MSGKSIIDVFIAYRHTNIASCIVNQTIDNNINTLVIYHFKSYALRGDKIFKRMSLNKECSKSLTSMEHVLL